MLFQFKTFTENFNYDTLCLISPFILLFWETDNSPGGAFILYSDTFMDFLKF